MRNKLRKCTIIFLIGVTISLASMAFFNQMMNMPQQVMTMGSTMMQGQDKPCDCSCPILK